ncbi:MAG: DUF2666 family protein [Candidatus Micrarchaeota archaeon]|nr:DUF2666 family protein [Candidatus Micrarchaeota archaeon]
MEDSILFTAKVNDWVSVKKMSCRDNTGPEEVAFQLASIRQALDRKSFEMLGINTFMIDEYVEKMIGGKRRSFNNLADFIVKIDEPEAKSVIKQASQEHQQAAWIYMFRKIVTALKFDFDVNQEMLADVYSNLKMPPMPKGRLPGAKKKK